MVEWRQPERCLRGRDSGQCEGGGCLALELTIASLGS